MTRYELKSKDGEAVQVSFRWPLTDGIVIGRTEAASDYLPDLDLAPVQARERGVSRRHAALLSFEDTLHVLDIQSANGTFINGRRIMPLTPHPLVTGDVVRFGGVELVLTEGS